jgi:hypothetical protein
MQQAGERARAGLAKAIGVDDQLPALGKLDGGDILGNTCNVRRADLFRQLERDGDRFRGLETNAFDRRSGSTRHGKTGRVRKPRQARAAYG